MKRTQQNQGSSRQALLNQLHKHSLILADLFTTTNPLQLGKEYF